MHALRAYVFLPEDGDCGNILRKCQNHHPMPDPGEQGWRSSESARLPPMCPRFDSWTWLHM